MTGDYCPETIAQEALYIFTVKDFKQHLIYYKIPCVAGRPYFRFDEGTPLKTTNGVNNNISSL